MSTSKGEQARQMVQAGAFLLDVRTPDEFRAGHIDGAVNIPVQVLGARLAEVPRGPVVVYCASGIRSAHATQMLKGAGIPEVFDLGSIGEWPR